MALDLVWDLWWIYRASWCEAWMRMPCCTENRHKPANMHMLWICWYLCPRYTYLCSYLSLWFIMICYILFIISYLLWCIMMHLCYSYFPKGSLPFSPSSQDRSWTPSFPPCRQPKSSVHPVLPSSMMHTPTAQSTSGFFGWIYIMGFNGGLYGLIGVIMGD